MEVSLLPPLVNVFIAATTAGTVVGSLLVVKNLKYKKGIEMRLKLGCGLNGFQNENPFRSLPHSQRIQPINNISKTIQRRRYYVLAKSGFFLGDFMEAN